MQKPTVAAAVRALADDPNLPTYELRAVFGIIGIDEGTATNWSVRGYPGCAIPRSGRGQPRRVTARTVVHYRIMKILVDLSLDVVQAADWAASCLELIDSTKKFSYLSVRKFAGQEERDIDWPHKHRDASGRALDDPIPRPKRFPPLEAAVTINLRQIIFSVLEALADLPTD